MLAKLANSDTILSMTEVGMHEAKTKLSQLVERAERGEEVVITRNGKPVVRLIPVEARASLASVRGAWRGQVTMASDFDELPDDIADAFGAT
jgi:prevent-host-death family protein